MNQNEIIKAKILYGFSFITIIPIFMHCKWSRYLKEQLRLLYRLKSSMFVLVKNHQIVSLDNLITIKSHLKSIHHIKNIIAYANYQIDLSNMFGFTSMSEGISRWINYSKLPKILKENFTNELNAFLAEFNIFRETYHSIYNKINRKYRSFPKKYLLKVYKFEGLKIW